MSAMFSSATLHFSVINECECLKEFGTCA